MTDDTFFWSVAAPLLQTDGVTRSTMMGYPCLRTDGDFFASVHPESGSLIVKLPAERVTDMISSGAGEPFAPSGRPFREWVLVRHRDAESWTRLLEDARLFVSSS